MSEDASRQPPENLMPPVSAFVGPIAELIGHGLLAPPSRPGLLATLDRFEILRVLGAGGMGVVLLGRDSQMGTQVAIKMVRPELLGDQEIVRRFLKEAGHLQRLRHKNVIEVSDVSHREQGPYFVMPYFEQGNLARRIRPGQPLDPELILKIATQLAEALEFAHRRGIIHRDLKPANVLLTPDSRACLADFGLARTVFNDTLIDLDNQQCEGTAPYMSPGVAAGNAEDTRCDIYAFGALLYEMLTGDPPYKGRTTKEIRENILAQPPKPISELNPKADRGLVAIAEGAMARELRDRYADIADILADLNRIKDGQTPVGPHGIGGKVRDNIQGVRRAPAIAWLVVAIALIGGLVWMLRPAKSSKAPQTVAPSVATRTPPPPPPIAYAPHFQEPWGIAVDRSGNVYASDSEAGAIFKITGAGQVTVLAGRPGYRGSTNGFGPNARFIIPRGLALDPAGNLYVADAYTLRKVTPDGAVTTLAGQPGYPGSADGFGTNAQFSWASGVAVDRAGTIYVADRYTIRKVTPAGEVTTLAGSPGHSGNVDGTGPAARFSDRDKAIAVDDSGTIYVADTYNNTIRKVSPNGEVTTLSGTNASFARSAGIAIDRSGSLYIGDTANHTIRLLLTPLAGTAGKAGAADGPCARALFNQPRGLAFDSVGNLYVADSGNQAIRKITPAGFVSTLAGSVAPLAMKK